MKIAKLSATLGLVVLVACGGGGAEAEGPKVPKKAGGGTATKPDEVSKNAEQKFTAAVDAFVEADKTGWNDAKCGEVAKLFEAAGAEQKGGLPEATFNAGLAYQRCGKDGEAKKYFQKALSENGQFHHSRAQLALYDYKASGSEDAAIGSLQQAVLDAKFQNVPALVNLAMFQMQRDSAQSGEGCKDDMECAKKNLQRALAIDDGYMPAFNQLALYYFTQAKKRVGSGGKVGKAKRQIATNASIAKRANVQELELAALVCSQAIRKNAKYAPIHNTAGLIQNELGLVNGAVSEFRTAAQLDPRLFEAQMNYAAVNLSFRGFEEAQKAYSKALEMRPQDYEAHLGLALALRGLITDVNYDKQVAAVQAELDAAKKIDAARPDAYYNEGILVQEYKSKGLDKDKQVAMLGNAQTILQSFIEKASGKPEYDGAVKRSKERIEDITVMQSFIKEGGNADKAPPPPVNTGDGAAPAAGGAPAGGATTDPAPAAPATPAKK
jgi:tetratricopeptide (TPR) repeat protein